MRLPIPRQLLIACFVTATSPTSSHGEEPNPALLVAQLQSRSFAEREAACIALSSLGEKATPWLRIAAKSELPEVRWRARRLLNLIMLRGATSPSLGLRMAVIHTHYFDMGSPSTERGHKPDETLHRVELTEPFLLGTHEVTQAQYRHVMKTEPSWFTPSGEGKAKISATDTGKFPVEQVTWYDAIAFCNALSKLDGHPPHYQITDVKQENGSITQAKVKWLGGSGYRLPTEAEWEYACRGGTQTPFHFGTSARNTEANLIPAPIITYGSSTPQKSLGRTAEVGSYPPNARGLYDMHGNVAEWCWDVYDKDYYAKSPRKDPTGPEAGVHRVLRGGSWLVNYENCRSASRFWQTPDDRKYFAGFRVARTP